LNSIPVGEWSISGLQYKKSSLDKEKKVLPELEITRIPMYLYLPVN